MFSIIVYNVPRATGGPNRNKMCNKVMIGNGLFNYGDRVEKIVVKTVIH